MKKKVLADRYLKMFKSIALGVILSTAGTSALLLTGLLMLIIFTGVIRWRSRKSLLKISTR